MSPNRLIGGCVLLAGSLGAAACGPSGPGPAAPLPSTPELGFVAPTTSPDTALANLDTQIQAARDALVRRPDVLGFRQPLVDLLLARMAFLGSFEDLDEANRVTQEGVEQHRDEPLAHLLRARYLGTVHEFDDATAALSRAEALGAQDLSRERQTYDLASGRSLRQVLVDRQRAVESHVSFESLSAVAAAHAAVGEFDQADERYRSALAAYRDVSPFAVAWLFFQRGVMWAEMAGRPDWGRPMYEEAVRRLPAYVSANVHLGELEFQAGERDRAVRRLTALTTGDPEPLSRLASWTQDQDPAAAAALAARARSRYESLMAAFPRAFLDHGSEFFVGAGADPGRGLALAEQNLAHRRDARAHLLVLQAAQAAGAPARACELAGKVPAELVAAHVPLRDLVSRQPARCTSR